MMQELNELLANSREFYFYLALGGSAVFIIQLFLILTGMGGDDLDADNFDPSNVDMTGGGDLSLVSFFSLRGLVAFVTFFGWAGYFWGHNVTGLAISLLCGVGMMAMTTLIVWFFLRMQQSGNIGDAEFVDKTGVVYLGIPGGDAASGVVTVQLPNCTRQIKAFAAEPLSSGTPVRVVGVVGTDYFRVEKINAE